MSLLLRALAESGDSELVLYLMPNYIGNIALFSQKMFIMLTVLHVKMIIKRHARCIFIMTTTPMGIIQTNVNQVLRHDASPCKSVAL